MPKTVYMVLRIKSDCIWRWDGNIYGRCNVKKPIRVISIHLLTMYGGGAVRGRGGRGVPRVQSASRARAPRTLYAAPRAYAPRTRSTPV